MDDISLQPTIVNGELNCNSGHFDMISPLFLLYRRNHIQQNYPCNDHYPTLVNVIKVILYLIIFLCLYNLFQLIYQWQIKYNTSTSYSYVHLYIFEIFLKRSQLNDNHCTNFLLIISFTRYPAQSASLVKYLAVYLMGSQTF